eukprot:2373881-Amphidinium_carterae.1
MLPNVINAVNNILGELVLVLDVLYLSGWGYIDGLLTLSSAIALFKCCSPDIEDCNRILPAHSFPHSALA